ncbi:MAG: HAMP domain-containing sensor histidine kinase [Cyanobacteria bacterium P01_H01_bin.121]
MYTEVVGFVVGLGAGGIALFLQQRRFNQQLQDLLCFLGTSPRLSLDWTQRLQRSITRHQRYVQSLNRDLSHLQTSFDQAPIAYVQVDRDNQLIWYNRAAGSLLQILQPLPEKPRLVLEVIRSYELDQLIGETRLKQRLCTREWTLNLVGTDPLNPAPTTSLQLMGHALPLPDNAIGVFLENRQEVVTLTQQRNRWVSDVAHELKTPLTSIRLVSETILNRVEPGLQTWVERLLGEVIHLSDLVQDLLDLSLMDRRALGFLKLSQVDLVTLIREAWNTLEPLTNQKQLTFNYEGPPSCIIDADATRLDRVIMNLLDNAIKYSPMAQPINVRLTLPNAVEGSVQQSFVILDVIDYGPGFPEQALAHVFERFYRADPARAKNDPRFELDAAAGLTGEMKRYHSSSSGLGLSIVQQIVSAHHGTVTAKNHPETGGAWLRVYLPAQAKQILTNPIQVSASQT